MAVRRPQLQFRVTRGAEPRQVVVAARIEIDTSQRLRVAAVEAFGESNHRGECPDGTAQSAREVAIAVVRLLRWGLPMVPRDQRDHLGLVRIEAAQVAVLDQVVGVAVMTFVADVHADVVQQRAIFQPLALAIGEAVHTAGLIEDAQCQTRNLLRVFRPVAAAFAQFDHASPPDVGVALGLADARAVAADVVEHQPFAERQVAQRELVGAEPAHDRVEEYGTSDRQIGASRIHRRDAQALLQV
jgi:hypothetical protein